MSWTRVLDPYQPFQNAADRVEDGQGNPPRFPVSIWESTDGTGKKRPFPHRTHPGIPRTQKCPSPAGVPEVSKVFDGVDFHPKLLVEEARVRIIFAPLDELLSDLAPGIVALCRSLSIPPEFLTERLQGVCHSFGTRTDERGVAAWFHYLCKAVEPGVAARHRWYKSAFFLRKDEHGNVTLVVFGPTPGVRARLGRFLAAATAQSWDDIVSEPLVLFDLILDGLFLEIDTTVWSLLNVISELESRLLSAANSRGPRNDRTNEINFAELHSWTKHLINLGEAIDSCLLVVNDSLANLGKTHPAWPRDVGAPFATTTKPTPDTEQVRETLRYRHSLFSSTRLRLTSLQKRVDNTTTLAFNLVTQQDSRLMMQDSASMTIISLITVLFLPTTGVAAVVGSQVFLTEFGTGTGADATPDVIRTSPLFGTLWWFAIPLTVAATGIAMLYRIFVSMERPIQWPFLQRLRGGGSSVAMTPSPSSTATRFP